MTISAQKDSPKETKTDGSSGKNGSAEPVRGASTWVRT